MKKYLLSLFLTVFCWGIYAQNYQVNTDLTYKNVLLEEFTGMRCGYCPEGHKIAARMKAKWGDRLSVVAIHCGYFAMAGPYEPDYRVPDGEDLGVFLGGVEHGFPNASISRRDWANAGSIVFSRGQWEGYAERALSETAPVNLWAKAVYDTDQRTLKIRVEGYFTEEVAETNCLNVFLIQNNVLGLQYSGGLGDRYPHQAMLRDAITSTHGEPLHDCRKGNYFSNEYIYEVPADYQGIQVEPADLELVVFVTNEQGKDVLNTINVKPEYTGSPLPLKADIAADALGVSDGYHYHFLPVVVKNRCNSVLHDAVFEVTLNGVSVEQQWTGEVAPFATQEIRLPIDWSQATEDLNVYSVRVLSWNGEVLEGAYFDGSYSGNLVQLPAHLKIKINTANIASENTYALYDEDRQLVRAFGPYEGGQAYEEEIQLEGGKIYCFEVTDSKGNGIYPWGNALEFCDENGMARFVKGTIDGAGYRFFFETEVPSGIEGVEAAEGLGAVYDMNGRLVATEGRTAHLPAGVYLIRQQKGGKKIVVR